MKQSVKYYGEWSEASTISQKLAGPIGQGVAEWETGDRFEGYFHLNYAYINGPCYVANGKYTFADGKYIDKAWIRTLDKLDGFGLEGLFEIFDSNGERYSITPFHHNVRHGVEYLASGKAIEWYKGEKLAEYEVESFSFETFSDKTTELSIDLVGGINVTMYGGMIRSNGYGYVYDVRLEGAIKYTDGTTFSSIGYDIRNLRPYNDKYGKRCYPNGRVVTEKYNGYELVSQEFCEWMESYAILLPNVPYPTDPQRCESARVWDGHIRYYDGATYDGEMEDSVPHGKGIFRTNNHEGVCYEGTFSKGRCHGKIIKTSSNPAETTEDEWESGKILGGVQSITLRYEWRYVDRKTEEASGEIELNLYTKIDLDGFRHIYPREITDEVVRFSTNQELHKGSSLRIYNEIEHEIGEVVSHTENYTLTLHWDEA